MAEFYKVSFDQFKQSCKAIDLGGSVRFDDDEKLREIYDAIQLPRRATSGSAGYDFSVPFDCGFNAITPVLIPTGVGVRLDRGTFLMCVPRSGLGFKYGMRLRNSVGIIDEDYSSADNEGHIMAKIDCDVPFGLKAGDRFMQGIVVPYGTFRNDVPLSASRTGGFGSTGGA